MDYLFIVLSSLFSVAVLFILTKLIGYRQMSQLSMFDYINGITIGSIAAEFATSPINEMVFPLIAMVIYALATYLLSVITDHSIKLRRVITGSPVFLMYNGQMYIKNFKKAKLDINEFLIQCRNQGYFDLSQISVALLEANGTVSILPKTQNRPATIEDLKISASADYICANVVIDGKIQNENVNNMGYSVDWLKKSLVALGYKRIDQIFIATLSKDGTIFAANKTNDTPKDIFV